MFCNSCGDNSCLWIIILIILVSCCGGGNGCNNGRTGNIGNGCCCD